MNSKQMTYFLAVVDHGTISAAAKALGIAQPSLSAQMQALEEDLGVSLMQRGGRQVQLTEAGQLLYRRACTILSLTDQTVREVQAAADGARGVVSLGTISSCSTILLEARLPAFRAAHPQVSFALVEGNTYHLMEKLRRGDIELSMMRTPFVEEGLDVHILAEEPLVLAARPVFFAGLAPGAVEMAQLATLPLIYYRRYEHLLAAALERRGLTATTYCKNDDARTCLLWAQAGLGVALVPRSVVAMLPASTLEQRAIAAPETLTRVALVRAKDRQLSHAADTFWTFMTAGGENIKK
ncbi:MAG: LysR family transcriptional regulator [Peptococcaceae bacterium]|nr:LysR family transcriptional regulator [Peptococcaceae bacterium]